MDIIIAKILDNEGQVMALEVFNSIDGGDFAEILDFFVDVKEGFGHSVVNRRSNQILFTDGVRVFLENSELMEIDDVKEYHRLKELDRKAVSKPSDGIILEPESTIEKP